LREPAVESPFFNTSCSAHGRHSRNKTVSASAAWLIRLPPSAAVTLRKKENVFPSAAVTLRKENGLVEQSKIHTFFED